MHVTFASGALYLEGEMQMPATPGCAAVVCHPHPQYGGNMFDPVVRTVAEALVACGCATLRFNFRGVGESQGTYAEGVGEADDAAAAVTWLTGRCGSSRVVLAGYSFGAMVALRAAGAVPGVERVIAVAPPIAFASLDTMTGAPVPTLFIAGSADPYCPADVLARNVAAGFAAAVCRIVPGADHFLYGHEPEIAAAVREFASAPAPRAS